MSQTIAVYGATGALGQLVARDLRRRGMAVRGGGRSREKLDQTETLQGPGTTRVAATVGNPAGLQTFLHGTQVLVNTARLTSAGTGRLVEAALEAGVHYIDAAGEQAQIADLFIRRAAQAAARGVVVVPACGFDYALGDCLAHVVAHPVEPVQEVMVAYAIAGADVSANSLQFAGETKAGTELLFEHGRWIPARLEILRRRVTFPEPFGTQVMARYAAGEVITVPRHIGTDRVTALITARSLVPHPLLVPLFPYLRPAVALLRRTPGRHLLAVAARVQRGSGASEDVPERDTPHFAIVVEATTADGTRKRGVAEGGSYHAVTAATLGFVATELSCQAAPATGVLAPASAVDPTRLLDDLGGVGVTWQAGL